MTSIHGKCQFVVDKGKENCIQFFFWECISVALSPSPSYLCPLSITVSRCRRSPLSLCSHCCKQKLLQDLGWEGQAEGARIYEEEASHCP